MENEKDLEYIKILKALMEIPFDMGKNLLADYLIGDYSNKSIPKNRLDELNHFGTLNWDKDKILSKIEELIRKGFIEQIPSSYNRFVKVLRITLKGRNEIFSPTLEEDKRMNNLKFKSCEINVSDRALFEKYSDFLEKFNDEQKKGIISDAKKILCIAGAGSGKTTVLTKRIEFLVKKKGVLSNKILAITFTRKARIEMKKRLSELNVEGVNVHTFNSFCEKILRENEMRFYGRSISVQTYQDKIFAMNMALSNLGLEIDDIIRGYYNPNQRRNKTTNQLINSFMNDCFSVIDFFKVTGVKEYDFSKEAELKNRHNARRVYEITKHLKNHMETNGLRDFTDQLLDALNFMMQNPGEIPKFEHVLVDEYQDVNSTQIKLLKLLKPENIFAVGDPRQAIFGWRGSDISYIINFEKDYGTDVEIIHLTKNYRSHKKIVEFMNHAIREMKLPDLESEINIENSSNIKIIDFETEEAEREFVLQYLRQTSTPKDEIFILARTNRQLNDFSRVLKDKGIPHVLKTDEVRNPKDSLPGELTLATVHAIKGLEANTVFLIGANDQNFPCKASDHPAIEMIKIEDYDKEEEERRLFYVAISRAKENLFITYPGKKPTYFVSSEMRALLEGKKDSKIDEFSEIINRDLLDELKSWRKIKSNEEGLPAFTIMHDKTIEEISKKGPKTPEELSKISGIGPSKLMKYGAQILDIVREFGDTE